MENLYLFTIGLLLIVIVYLALKMNHHKYWHKHYKDRYNLPLVECMMCHKPKKNDGHTCCEDCAGVSF